MKVLNEIDVPGLLEIKVVRAEPGDYPIIKELYDRVYQGKYTLPEVIDPRRNYEVLADENNLWLLAMKGDKAVGSLLTLIDKRYGIGKLIAAVVLPEYRNKGILKRLMIYSLEYASKRVDVLYAITRTVDIAPQKVLKRFNFKPLGIFPNVRLLKDYETHILFAAFFNEALSRRAEIKSMITPVKRFYDVVKEELKLGDIPVNDNVSVPLVFKELEERVVERKGDTVREEYLRELRKEEVEGISTFQGKLRTLYFFPFHIPNYYFEGTGWKAFVYYSHLDKHSAIVTLRFNGLIPLANALKFISKRMDQIGAKYLELVIDARYPELHKLAYSLGFLPCAYFPAASNDFTKKPITSDIKVDQVVFTYPLTFPRLAGLKLTREAYNFMIAFLENIKDRLSSNLDTIEVFS